MPDLHEGFKHSKLKPEARLHQNFGREKHILKWEGTAADKRRTSARYLSHCAALLTGCDPAPEFQTSQCSSCPHP